MSTTLIFLGEIPSRILNNSQSLFSDLNLQFFNIIEDQKSIYNKSFSIKIKKPQRIEDYDIIKEIKQFKSIPKKNNVLFFLNAGEDISFATLTILSQLKDKEIFVILFKEDSLKLSTQKNMQQNIVFKILQEYSRSGKFKNLYLYDFVNISTIKQDEINFLNYSDIICNNITAYLQTHLYVQFNEPIFSTITKNDNINRISTLGILDIKSEEETLLFNLNNIKEKNYYFLLTKETLADPKNYHKIQQLMTSKIKNIKIKQAYAVYQSPYSYDFCLTTTNTSVIQDIQE